MEYTTEDITDDAPMFGSTRVAGHARAQKDTLVTYP